MKFKIGDKVKVKASTIADIEPFYSSFSDKGLIETYKSTLTINYLDAAGTSAGFLFPKGMTLWTNKFFFPVDDLEFVEEVQSSPSVPNCYPEKVESNEHHCDSRICLHENEPNAPT